MALTTKPIDMALWFDGGDAAGPASGSGVLLESDVDGTTFVLLETGSFVLLDEP